VTAATDVVVVGAGIIGSSVALACARAGWSVTVVDRNGQPGHGSTSASAGIIRVHATDLASCVLADEALSAWRNWRDFTSTPEQDPVAEFTQCGSLILDTGSDFCARITETMTAAGVEHRYAKTDALTQLAPFLDLAKYGPPRSLDDDAFWQDAVDDLPGGVYTPGSGYCTDPALAAQNLAAAAGRAGAQIRLGVSVVGVGVSDNRVTEVSLSDGIQIACRTVVNAAGPHSGQMNEIAGVGEDFKVGVRRIREELHVVPAPLGVDFERDGMHVVDDDLGINFRPESGNTILVGSNGADVDGVEPVDDPDTFNTNPTVSRWERDAIRLARRIPGLRIPPRPSGVAGLYDVTDDWLPIYDRTPLEGYYVAIGTSGNQFKTAPIVGGLMQALIAHGLDGRDQDQDPLLFHTPFSQRVIDTSAFSRLRTPLEGAIRG
jgi:sarcosine oxidase subunit beta